MTHLVTRLRALADDITGPSSAWAQTDVIADAILEAADGLELCKSRLLELAEEILDLKAKLADAVSLLEHSRDCHVETAKRAEKAEAEAAALKKALQDMNVTGWRELRDKADIAIAEVAALRDIAQDLCDFNAKYLDEMRSKETWAVEGTLEESPFVTRFRHALSQPGPGAAYQERLRETESKFATQSHNLNVMNERLKKLEAVAEAVVECRKIDRIVMGDIMTPTVINMSPFKRLEDALAALEEKA